MARTSRARTCVASAVLLLLGALAGCGSDDDAQAVASLKAEILSNDATQGAAAISDKQAGCIARGAVDGIGVDELQDYEILDGDLQVDRKIDQVALSRKDAEAFAGVFLRCADVEKVVEDRLVDQVAAGGRRAAVERCVRRTVTPAVVRTVLAQSFEQAEPTQYSALGKRLARCR